jgi:hypothetical protein
MQFRPGVSGNPAGRPKKSVTLALVNDLAAEASPGAMAQLIAISRTDLAEHPELVNAVRAACNDILDRGIGKALQPEALTAIPTADLRTELERREAEGSEPDASAEEQAQRLLLTARWGANGA